MFLAANCGHLVDLAFLLDSSGSIRYKNWKKIRLFLKTLVAELGSAGEVRFSVMEYSVGTKIEVKVCLAGLLIKRALNINAFHWIKFWHVTKL